MSKESDEMYEKELNGRPIVNEELPTPQRSRRHSPSLFGPIVLIAIGIFFLLNNLGLLPPISLNWGAALQLWPLFLIMIGLNIIVKQAPQPLGGLLSALVGLVAVGIFGYMLLFGESDPRLAGLGFSLDNAEVQQQQISVPADGVTQAQVEMDFGLAGASLSALEDSNDLIAGDVTYIGDLRFDANVTGSEATVYLGEKNGGLFWLNPANWGSVQMDRWQLALHPQVALDLRLDVSAGAVELDLSELTLRELALDGGAGGMTVILPDGDYDSDFEIEAGSLSLTVGENGRQTIEIDGGAGSLTLVVPSGREARIEVDDGAGSFNVDNGRFTQVSNGDDDNTVWQTANYNRSADDALLIQIDMGAGSVTLQRP